MKRNNMFVSAVASMNHAWASHVREVRGNENGLKFKVHNRFGSAAWHPGAGSMGGYWSNGSSWAAA